MAIHFTLNVKRTLCLEPFAATPLAARRHHLSRLDADRSCPPSARERSGKSPVAPTPPRSSWKAPQRESLLVTLTVNFGYDEVGSTWQCVLSPWTALSTKPRFLEHVQKKHSRLVKVVFRVTKKLKVLTSILVVQEHRPYRAGVA